MDAVAQVDAIIIPDDHLVYDIIVGRDFLEQEHVVVIKKRNKVIFKQLRLATTTRMLLTFVSLMYERVMKSKYLRVRPM